MVLGRAAQISIIPVPSNHSSPVLRPFRAQGKRCSLVRALLCRDMPKSHSRSVQLECRRQASFQLTLVCSCLRQSHSARAQLNRRPHVGRKSMIRTCMIAAACAAVLMNSPVAVAQGQFGTADEAKAMLVKAAAALKADKTKTLDLINKGEGGFLDRDIYPFCFDLSDGKIVAVASNNAKQFLGTDIRALKDATGKVYGPDL